MGLITSLQDIFKLFVSRCTATTTMGIQNSRPLFPNSYSLEKPKVKQPSGKIIAALGVSLDSIDWGSGAINPAPPVQSIAKKNPSAESTENDPSVTTLPDCMSGSGGNKFVAGEDPVPGDKVFATDVEFESSSPECSERSEDSDRTVFTTKTSVHKNEVGLISQPHTRNDVNLKAEACAYVLQDPPKEAFDTVIELDINTAAQNWNTDLQNVPHNERVDRIKAQLPKNISDVGTDGVHVSRTGMNKSFSNDNGDEDNEDTNGHEEPLVRQDWEPIRRIPDEKFKDIVLHLVDDSGELEREDVDLLARFEGGFHHVVMLRVYDEDNEQDYVIKVPGVGTQSRWRPGDAHNMCAEADLMKYLFEHTNMPVPEVIAYEEGLDIILGAPYILMKRVPGRPAYELWYEDASIRNYIDAGSISKETEEKRINMLRSLASTMARLHKVEFEAIGMPIFTNGSRRQHPSAVHAYRWKDSSPLTHEDLDSDTQLYQYGPFASSSEYMTSRLDSLWPKDNSTLLDQVSPEFRLLALGIRKVLDIIFSHPIIKTSISPNAKVDDKETFVLQHPDLDLQNILVDDDGNVTGILDWDGCLAVPRCVGYASLPEFLCRDWQPGFTLDSSPHIGWQLDHYRQIYAEAMEETGCPESRFTQKSCMYRAIEESLTSKGDAAILVKKILLELSGLRRTNINEFLMLLGRDDWTEAKEWLSIQIGELLDIKQMPR